MNNHNIEAFYALLRAGLWENCDKFKVPESRFQGKVDWEEVYRLAVEQSVIGVVLAGIEHSNVKPSQDLLLQWIGEVQILEQQNKAMNQFIAELIEKTRKVDIYTLLVKGQGIAQCYEKPLWRASGDVDFYLSDVNFKKAKDFFRPLVDTFDPDIESAKHINMHYGEWTVELHANQHSSLSPRINKVIDEIHHSLFYDGEVRSVKIEDATIFLPSPDNDILLIFTHFLNHFFRGGVGLRQICDWCRLLWTYRDSLDYGLLENRLRQMGLLSIWKGFAAFSVKYMGMSVEAMPFYTTSEEWSRKADKIGTFILEVGNFGKNRDLSYYDNHSRLICKAISLGRRCRDMMKHITIFPLETLRLYPCILYYGIVAAAEGE